MNMESSSSGCNKRKADQLIDSSLPNIKNKFKKKVPNEFESLPDKIDLMCLPDDVLYIVLSNLHPKDRLEMGLTCKRMLHLVNASNVWKKVDCRPLHVNNLMFEKLIKFLSFGTLALSIRGYAMKHLHADIQPTCTPQLLHIIKDKCTKIKILRIEEDLIHNIAIKDFPSTLEELSLAGSANRYFNSENSVPYFFRIEQHLPNLTTLCLRQCRWFEPHALMILSKLPHLHSLDVSKCSRLGECVPYFSLAMRHGFKKLRVLDLRHTMLGDSEVSCLKSLPCLRELLLECPINVQHENSHDNANFSRNPVVVIRPLYRQIFDNQLPQVGVHNANMEDNIDNRAIFLRMPAMPRNRPLNIDHMEQEQIIIQVNRNFDNNNVQNELPQVPVHNVIEGGRNHIRNLHARLPLHDNHLGINDNFHMPHLTVGSLITDRAICGFGNSMINNELNLIRIQGEHAAEECESLLERIVVRNYTSVSDRSLRHLARAIPHLKFLDVRGTTVTKQGVEKFMRDCPDCHIRSDINI